MCRNGVDRKNFAFYLSHIYKDWGASLAFLCNDFFVCVFVSGFKNQTFALSEQAIIGLFLG